MSKFLKSDALKVFLFIFFLFGSLAFVLNFQRVLIPFGIAYILSLVLRPIQKLFFSVNIGKKFIGVILLFLSVFLFAYPIIKGVQTLTDESHRLEYYIPKLELYLRKKYSSFKAEVEERFNFELTLDPVDSLLDAGQEATKSIVVYLPQILASTLEWGLLIPLFLFFILKDERRWRFGLIKFVPNALVERVYHLYYQFNTKFGDYIFAKFIEASIVGAVITLGLVIIGFPFAFLLGLIAGITNILPYIGPFIGFLPALVVGLVDQNPNTTLGAMTLLYVVANIIDLALVFPLLVSKIVNLHPMVVVISVIIGSQFGGVIGMVISIPFVAFLKLLLGELYRELYQ